MIKKCKQKIIFHANEVAGIASYYTTIVLNSTLTYVQIRNQKDKKAVGYYIKVAERLFRMTEKGSLFLTITRAT